jgi:hypothetical protein
MVAWQRHVAGAVAEVFCAAASTPQVPEPKYAVQIQFENLIFRIFVQSARIASILRERSFPGSEEVLGELLRQSRTALHHAAAREITKRARNS